MYSMRKDWNKKNLSKLRTKVNLASIISFLQYYISILSTSIYTYHHYVPTSSSPEKNDTCIIE